MEGENKPCLSVVLPVFNGERTILRAITSIQNQTFSNWELIVINDGSNDSTVELLKNCHDPRIRIFSIPHSGIAKALNFGIKMTKATVIARMDADDECLPERLKTQYSYLTSNPEVGLVSCQVKHMGVSDQEGYKHYVDWTNSLIGKKEIYLARFQDAPLAHPSVMFRKSIFSKFGGYNETGIPEDFELWLRWLQSGVRMVKLPEILLKWYDYPSRLSRVHNHYAAQHFFKVKAHYFCQWYQNKSSRRLIWVFGSGRSVNQRVKPLTDLGFRIEKFIDVKFHEDPKFIHYKDIPIANTTAPLILSYVSDRKGKSAIKMFLVEKGYIEGRDFLMMA